MSEQDLLLQAIAAMEAQRAVLGNAVVNLAIDTLREQLAALQAQPSLEPRRLVTALMAEFESKTGEGQASLDSQALNSAWKRLGAAVAAQGGWVVEHTPHNLLALWGAQETRDEDAEQAVHAALAITRLVEEEHLPLQLRIALHTLQVNLLAASPGQPPSLSGWPAHLPGILLQPVPAGGILVTQETLSHIRGVFHTTPFQAVQLAVDSDPLPTFQVHRARVRAFRMGMRGIEGIETRMIGRDAQFSHLQSLFSRVCEGRTLQLVTISADAGVGKSRLLHEFSKYVDSLPQPVRFFKGQAEKEMLRTPYSLLRDMFSYRFQILDTDDSATLWSKVEKGVAESLGEEEGSKTVLYAHFIGHLLGFDFSQSPHLATLLSDSRQIYHRAQAYMVHYLEGFCRRQPVLILLEDIHLADEPSLQVLQNLAGKLQDFPILILCTARPSLYERKPEWAGLGERMHLLPLTEPSARELIQHILRKVSSLPSSLLEMIITGTEGNPFYIEELTKMLIEDQVILKGEDTWQVDISRLHSARVPSTMTGVLKSRLDSLQTHERFALQCAAVVGSTFWDAAVERLLIQSDRSHPYSVSLVEEIFSALRNKEMIYRRDKSAFSGTHEYLFKNLLFREVAYESIPMPDRQQNHSWVAGWLINITRQSGRQDEYARLIAEHLELANQTSAAAEWYARAAAQAAARFAPLEAAHCFSRAFDLSSPDDLPGRFALLSGREAMYDLQAERALQILDLQAMSSLCEKIDDLHPRIHTALRRANYSLVTGDYPQAAQAAQGAFQLAHSLGDPALQSQAGLHLAQAYWRQSNYPEAREKLIQALDDARQAGSLALEAESLRNLGVIEEDQGNFQQSRLYYQQTLSLYQRIGDRVGEANTYSNLGNLALDLNDQANSLSHHQAALQLRIEIGDRRGQARSLGNLGFIASDQGDYSASKDFFERALVLFRQINDSQGEAVALVNLGNDAMTQGDYLLAMQYQQQALEIQTRINNRIGESIALDNLCLIHHYLGDHAQALKFANQALEIARSANLLHVLGYIYNHRGHALLALGELERAKSAYQKSLELRQELGENTLALEPLAGLVRTSLAGGQIKPAAQMAEQLSIALQSTSLDGMVEPFLCYLSAYQALQAVDSPTAAALLQHSRQLLLARAEKIRDNQLRRSFLEKVAIHRQILELSQAQDDSRQLSPY